MRFNSSVISPNDILRGSGMLEIALYGSDDWFNVGAISDMSFNEDFDTYMAEDDTIYEKNYVVNQNVSFGFTQHEALNSDVYAVLRGVDTITEQLSGTDEEIKITSGDLTDLNEIKARITTKLGDNTFYVYFHRGFVTNGKGFRYQGDGSEDSRVNQEWEIIFLPDSTNSDQIYYTVQPAIFNEKFHKCQGDIRTGVTLYIGPSGNMPLSTWTLYDSETYDDSTYAPTAFYESRLMYKAGDFSSINWTATGGANDIKFSYRYGDTIDSLSAWTSGVDAIGVGETQSLNTKYFQYRFIFYSSTWNDSDGVVVNSIT